MQLHPVERGNCLGLDLLVLPHFDCYCYHWVIVSLDSFLSVTILADYYYYFVMMMLAFDWQHCVVVNVVAIAAVFHVVLLSYWPMMHS